MTKERPILFKGEMVRAILEGRKTQTRRIVKPQPYLDDRGNLIYDKWNFGQTAFGKPNLDNLAKMKCPYGQVGDRLWVRETWGICPDYNQVKYKADRGSDDRDVYKWKPSIHMKRKYSRINLEITGIRIERLQDITEKDAQTEGVSRLNLGDLGIETNKSAFRSLWDNINASMGYGWNKNPWVWVVEFRRVK
jgi:hypothetical protein